MNKSERQLTLRWVTPGLPLSLAVVLGVTLYPFEIACPATMGQGAWLPALAGGMSHPWDIARNLVLFMPLGYMIAATAASLRRGRGGQLMAVLAIGGSLALLIESLQLCIGQRFAALTDVGANGSGALIGGLAWIWWGQTTRTGIRKALARFAQRVGRYSSPLLAIYSLMIVSLSMYLQTRTLPRNWTSEQSLLIGNERGDRWPWEGLIRGVAILDRTLTPDDLGPDLPSDAAVLAAYQFSGGTITTTGAQAPRLLPRGSAGPLLVDAGALVGRAGWLASDGRWPEPAAQVSRAVSVVLHLRSASPNQSGPARIITLSKHQFQRNLTIAQAGDSLIVRVRSPLTGRDADRPQFVFPGVFDGSGPQRIGVSYDGAAVVLYVDGVRHPTSYDLGPGAALAGRWTLIRLNLIRFWSDGYSALMMLPWAIGVAHAWWRGHWVAARMAGGALAFLALLALARAVVLDRPWQAGDLAGGLIAGTALALVAIWILRPLRP